MNPDPVKIFVVKTACEKCGRDLSVQRFRPGPAAVLCKGCWTINTAVPVYSYAATMEFLAERAKRVNRIR